jgi:hypothetical protein
VNQLYTSQDQSGQQQENNESFEPGHAFSYRNFLSVHLICIKNIAADLG